MTTLVHKERTLQDIIDEMTPEQRETMDIVVGAAVEDEPLDDAAIEARYRALPAEIIYLIDFVVGSVLAQQDGELAQDNLRVTSFLQHFGVKGMKWGVRNVDRPSGSSGSGTTSKSQKKAPSALVGNGSAARLSGSTMNTKENRAAARAQVRKGTASAETAHVAALKSTGHRVANAFLGDKTYWKGVAITAGVAGATIGATAALPLVLPASTLATIGSASYFALGSMVSPAPAAAAAMGSTAIATAGITAATVGASVSSSVLQVTNLVRAVRGNSRIDASYERLGSNLINTQKNGAKRTAKILSKDGGTSRRKTRTALSQSDDLRVDNFLEHFGVKGMKWGVRNVDRSTSSSKGKTTFNGDGKLSSDEAKAVATQTAKIAFKYGAVPAVVAVGATVGLPYTPFLAVGARALQDPAVQSVVKPAAAFTKDVVNQFGDIPLPNLPKVSNPFGTKTTTSALTKAGSGDYIDGEMPFHTGRNGGLVPNPEYVGKK